MKEGKADGRFWEIVYVGIMCIELFIKTNASPFFLLTHYFDIINLDIANKCSADFPFKNQVGNDFRRSMAPLTIGNEFEIGVSLCAMYISSLENYQSQLTRSI